VLGTYAWFELGVICEYCSVLYVTSLGVFLAARLLNPEGVLRGLFNGCRRMTRIGLMVVIVAATAFAAVALVQKRQLNKYIAEILRAPTKKGSLSCAEERLERLPDTHFKLESDTPPALVVAVFIDFACPHCRKEFEFWREYQLAHHEWLRSRVLPLLRRPRLWAAGQRHAAPQQSCNAALAAECLGTLSSASPIDNLASLFAMQDLKEPDFSKEHLAELSRKLDVPGLLDCMNEATVRERVLHHIRFGKSKRLDSPPSALLVPMKRQGRLNRPQGNALVLLGGEKSPDYIDAA
jgi:hypothetical protein